jgi:hypothetical protein
MAKKNNNNFELILIPPPSKKLTAKQAVEWLEGPHRVYTEMMQYSEDARRTYLTRDIDTMLLACAAAIRGGSVRLCTCDADDASDIDFLNALRDVVTLAALPSPDDYGDDTWGLVRPDLRREAERRLALLDRARREAFDQSEA